MNEKSKSTLEKMTKKMRLQNYSEQSIDIYISYTRKFLSSFKVDVYHISTKEAKIYIENYNYSSISQQNQIINSIKFLYRELLNNKLTILKISRPRKERKLPKIIDSELIKNRLSKIVNLKHQAILSITYSVGLRVSEIVNLKIKDIDSVRMLIHIKNAKGRKDRIVPLSPTVLTILREYYKKYKPTDYLFNGQKSLKYSISSCQKIYKKYINNETSIHNLRHSSFTNMLENGTDLRIIQKIAGHSSSKTTEIYTHVSNKLLNKVILPL